MKNKYIIPVLAMTMATALSGCSDFLDPKAKSEFVPKDAQSLNELLLGEAYPTTNFVYLEGFMNMLDDDVAAAPFQKPGTGQSVDHYFYVFSWQGDLWRQMDDAGVNVAGCNMYSSIYTKILGCNAVIDYIDQVVDTKDNVNEVLAQAYALRGFYNLQLVNLFGQPYQMGPGSMGIPLKLSSGIEDRPLKRNTVKECYDRIIADLKEAEKLYESLPVARQWKAHYFRTNLPMVYLLLSRAYLYTEQWSLAAEYAKKVMDDTRFKYVDLRNISSVNEKGQLTYFDYNSFEVSPEIIWPYGNVKDVTLWLTDNYYTNDRREIHSWFRASNELMESFDATPGDLRKDRYVVRSWFKVPTADGTDEEPMPQAIGKINVTSGKYMPSGGDSRFGRSLRLSEATLNYAEAMARSASGEDAALNAINDMRRYRFAAEDYVRVTKADCPDGVLQFVLDERRRELCFEGHRWFDLRRNGMPAIKHVWYPDENSVMEYTLQKNDPMYTIPVPITSLELNSELEQIPVGTVPRVGVSL